MKRNRSEAFRIIVAVLRSRVRASHNAPRFTVVSPVLLLLEVGPGRGMVLMLRGAGSDARRAESGIGLNIRCSGRDIGFRACRTDVFSRDSRNDCQAMIRRAGGIEPPRCYLRVI